MYTDVTEQFIAELAFHAMKAPYIPQCSNELEPLLSLLSIVTYTGKKIKCVRQTRIEQSTGSHYLNEFVYMEVGVTCEKRYATIKPKRVAGNTSLVLQFYTKSGNKVGKQLVSMVVNDPLGLDNRIYLFTVYQLLQLMCIYFDTGKYPSEAQINRIEHGSQK